MEADVAKERERMGEGKKEEGRKARMGRRREG